MDAGANGGILLWQLLAGAAAAAIVLVGAAWFWVRWQAHDDHGRPRPPDVSP